MNISSVALYGVELVKGAIILAIFYILGIFSKYIIQQLAKKFSNEKKVIINFLATVVKNVVISIGILSACGTLGVDVSAIIASLGLVGFALGFALKDIIANLLSGVLIIFNRPFNIGQFIKIANFTGVVTQINLRYTILEQDNYKIVVPNSLLLTKEILVSNQAIER